MKSDRKTFEIFKGAVKEFNDSYPKMGLRSRRSSYIELVNGILNAVDDGRLRKRTGDILINQLCIPGGVCFEYLGNSLQRVS